MTSPARYAPLAAACLLLANGAPARAQPPQQPVRLVTSKLDPSLNDLRRAAAEWALRGGPTRRVVDQVCLVPDVATFYEALSTWDDSRYFPILIDDVDLDLKFLQAFRPARVVRYPGRGRPIEPGQAWDRAVAAVGAAWSADDAPADARLKGDERPERLGKTPPGAVVGRSESASLPGLAALAAGRFQPMIRFEYPKRYGEDLRVEEADAFFGGIETAVRAKFPAFNRLGDDCDFLTLAGDYPYVLLVPQGPLAVDDIVGRKGKDLERWAYSGRLLGDARRSVYAAMCSLFLAAEPVLCFDGYGENEEGRKFFTLRPAAARLAPYLKPIKIVSGFPNATPAAWHAAVDPVARFGLIFVNSHGSPDTFHVMGGTLRPVDLMPSVPAVVSIIHSFSAQNPNDPKTIAGRWLEQGAFLYYGSLHEPQLPAFRLPSLSGDLLASGYPFAAAMRPTRGEPFGQPWRLVVLGDPLYQVRRTEPVGPRLREFPTSPEWVVYVHSDPPPPDSPEASRLGWALNEALIAPTSSAPDPADRLLAVLRSIDRGRLAVPLRPVYDDLRAVLSYQTGRFAELRGVVAALPAEGRSAVAARLALAGLVSEFQGALARRDFDRGSTLWAELLKADIDDETRKLFTVRLGALADSPARRDAWRVRLRAASSRLGEPRGAAVLGDELKRTEAAMEADRSRAPR